MMSNYLKILLLPFVLALTSCNSDSRITQDRTELAKLVAKFSPKANIIKESDVDTTSCGYVSDPGIVIADFNGDKKNDYAVLLQMSEPVDTAYIQGQDTFSYKNAELALVIFLTEKEGKFKTVTMNERVDFAEYPLNLTIQTQPTGTIKEFEGFPDREAKEI